MQITKEVLLADREAISVQIKSAQSAINYIDGLLAFLEKPESETEQSEVVENPNE